MPAYPSFGHVGIFYYFCITSSQRRRPQASSSLFEDASKKAMIDKELLIKTVEQALEGTDMYTVDITVSPADVINVEIDSDTNVDIDTCARITRLIESVFDRDTEDYELEVGSAGLTAPLKVIRQYRKNIGNDMEVLTRDGRKLRGVLAEASIADNGDIAFGLDIQSKEKEPGAKRPTIVTRRIDLTASECKYVRYDLKC